MERTRYVAVIVLITISTMPPVLLSMFQCIVVTEHHDGEWDLRAMRGDLEARGHGVKAFAPGSLGVLVKDDAHQIGSLSVKLVVGDANVSALVFKTSKIKLSGGLNKTDATTLTDATFDRVLRDTYIIPAMRTLFGESAWSWTVTKKMLNGCMYKREPIGKKNYMRFIQHLKTVFREQDIVLPEIMQSSGKRRGRICAVKVKNHTVPGSFAVDHSGNVQFFAYSNVEGMLLHASQLEQVWV